MRVRVGFNHRYHPALQKAREIVDSGALGPLMFVRGRYGHGGRVGYDREWRANPAMSGGGELIDQGVHLIDLARWFLGPFTTVDGFAATYFWDMPVDDNAFLTLAHGRRAGRVSPRQLHASGRTCSRSRSTGATASWRIDGLGGSYGVERLTWYRMLPEMGPPDTTSLGVSARRPVVGDRVRASSSRTSARREPSAGLRRRASGARSRRDDLRDARAIDCDRSPSR